MTEPVLRSRHWRQRFDPNAEMRFRKRVKWSKSITYEPGDKVPEDLMAPNKLRRWWEAGYIELLIFPPKKAAPEKVKTDNNKKTTSKSKKKKTNNKSKKKPTSESKTKKAVGDKSKSVERKAVTENT